MFDGLPGGQQVKCWALWQETGRMYVRYGEAVPELDGLYRYQVALREGGFAQVRRQRFVFISKKPRNVPMFDKWGARIEEVPEGYLLEDWQNDPAVKAATASPAPRPADGAGDD